MILPAAGAKNPSLEVVYKGKSPGFGPLQDGRYQMNRHRPIPVRWIWANAPGGINDEELMETPAVPNQLAGIPEHKH